MPPPDGGGNEDEAAENWIQSKLPTAFVAFASRTSRAICTPALSVTVRVTVCHACHPPVFGTVTGPVTSAPFISRWNVPPCPEDATRNAAVYAPGAVTLTE